MGNTLLISSSILPPLPLTSLDASDPVSNIYDGICDVVAYVACVTGQVGGSRRRERPAKLGSEGS